MSIRRRLSLALALGLAVGVHPGQASAVEDPCIAMDDAIYERRRPADGIQLLTPWGTEAVSAAIFGFTDDRGVPFQAATTRVAGLVPVERVYNRATRDFAYLTDQAEIANAIASLGYVAQGSAFFAAPEPLACTQPVHRLRRGAIHRLALDGERPSLEAAGWHYEMVAFHAVTSEETPAPPPPTTTAPPPPTTTPPPTTPTSPPPPPTTTAPPPTTPVVVDATFSFAVIPDTQNETYAGEVRMQERVEWLLANRDDLDLEWVLHSGDVHNWPTPDNAQFAAMSAWLAPLGAAGLPYVLTVGNHDTAAVCPGGSACPGQDAHAALRNTSAWNAYYSPDRFGFQGVFEAGKSDNGYRTFSAGGKEWLVLSLELWPRSAVVEWAERVVAEHPQHNVIVVTHNFLDGSGQLSGSNGGYGDSSPAVLWNALDDYPNVVMTFSGHVGEAMNTSLTAVDGHKVGSFLQTFHDPSYNPTRIVTVDTDAGTISTRIVANYDRLTRQNVDYEYTAYRTTVSGMRFVE